MAGIDNIKNEILQEAKDKADEVIARARKEAEAQIAEAQAQADGIAKKAAEKADQEAAAYDMRITSQIGMRKRQAVLKIKQQIIGEVIDEACSRLVTQPDASYFEMIEKLVKKNVRGADGEILFSKKDLDRLPEGFKAKAASLAKSAGGSLKVSDQTADIENGFILRYGGIEENCTLAALFAEKRDMLCDKVNEVLW